MSRRAGGAGRPAVAGEGPVLTISPAAADLGLKAAYLVVQNLRNAGTVPVFESYKEALCARLRRLYTDEFVEGDPTLAGFRELRKRIGRSSRRFPTSTDSLIGFLRRKGTIPSISFAVDVYNCVSLETRLTLGAHDLAKIRGDVHLRLVRGDERFLPLGAAKEERAQPGEFGYVDDGGDLLCRLDYKQADRTKVTLETTGCFYIVQGNPSTALEDLDAAAARLAALIGEYAASEPTFAFGRAHPPESGRAGGS